MFSGKTAELQRRLRRAKIAKLHVLVYKPSVDTRYGQNQVTSHDNLSIDAKAIQSASEILRHAIDADVIGIDEAQFFDDSLPAICEELANNGKRVIISGLDIDSFGQAFGPMPELMAKAEYVTKLHAICTRCGELAHYSYRKSPSKDTVMLGAEDKYEALCRNCYNQANAK